MEVSTRLLTFRAGGARRAGLAGRRALETSEESTEVETSLTGRGACTGLEDEVSCTGETLTCVETFCTSDLRALCALRVGDITEVPSCLACAGADSSDWEWVMVVRREKIARVRAAYKSRS